MRKRVLILSAVFMLFFCALSSAQAADKIGSLDITVNLVNGNSLVKYDLKSIFSGSMRLNLPKDAKILSISSKNYSFNEGVLDVRFDKNLVFEYLTESFVDEGKRKYFVAGFSFPLKIDKFSLKVILSEGTVLDDPRNVFPKAIISSDGVNIALNWNKENVLPSEGFSVFMVLKMTKDFSNLLIAGGLILTLILLYILVSKYASNRYLKPRAIRKNQKKTVSGELHLLESEKAVISALRETGGEMWQKQIQLKTGFSKAKLSRLIRALEARGLIRRIPLGNTNKIKLVR